MRARRLKAATQPSSGSNRSITTHGWDERNGTLNVARTDATALACQIRRPRIESEASDAASSHSGNRQLLDSPSNESTREDEMPLTPGGALASNTSSAEAKGP